MQGLSLTSILELITYFELICFVSNLTPLVELYHIQQRIPCVDWKCDWQKEFGNATVLIRSRNIFAHKLQKLYSLDGIGLKGIRDWYDVCAGVVFKAFGNWNITGTGN